MKSIELSAHLSLAYELGAGFYPEEKQSQLYGVKAGEEIRGQNLKVTTIWESLETIEPAALYQRCLSRQKDQLKNWDHSFIKQESEFKTQALTLENLTLNLAKGFGHYSTPKCLTVEMEQGLWGVRVDVIKTDLVEPSITLLRQLRFQSLIETEQGFEPIDMSLVLAWSGNLDRKQGLLQPWTELLAPVGQVYKNLRLEGVEYFKADSVAVFLKKIASRIFQEDSRLLLTDVSFIDTKDSLEISFNRLKDFS